MSVLIEYEWSAGVSKLDSGDVLGFAHSWVLDADAGLLLSRDEDGFRSSCMLDARECTLLEVDSN